MLSLKPRRVARVALFIFCCLFGSHAVAQPAATQAVMKLVYTSADKHVEIFTNTDLDNDDARNISDKVEAAYTWLTRTQQWRDERPLNKPILVHVVSNINRYPAGAYSDVEIGLDYLKSNPNLAEGTIANELCHIQDQRELVGSTQPDFITEGRGLTNGFMYRKSLGIPPQSYDRDLAGAVIHYTPAQVAEVVNRLASGSRADDPTANRKLPFVGAWFVEYLRTTYNGHGFEDVQPRLARTIANLRQGMTFEPAFKAAFGVNFSDVQTSFIQYAATTHGVDRLKNTMWEGILTHRHVFAIVAAPRVFGYAPFRVHIGSIASTPAGNVAARAVNQPAFPLSPISKTNFQDGPVPITYLRDGEITNGFWIDSNTSERWLASSKRPVTIPVRASLMMRTAHADVWIDQKLDPSARAQLQDPGIPAVLEAAWLSTKQHFGDLTLDWNDGAQKPCTGSKSIVTANGRYRLLIVAPERMGAAYAGSNYYRPECFPHAPWLAHMNTMSSLVVVSWNILTSPHGRDLKTAILNNVAHEVQHQANYIRHYLSPDEPFMNEGLSTLAQDLAMNDDWKAIQFGSSANPNRAQLYFSSPESYDLVNIRAATNVAASGYSMNGAYGSAYLLQRFLLDTYGENYLKRIYSDTTHVGVTELETATDLSINDVLIAFTRALWTGIDGKTLFDVVRNEGAQRIGARFLDVHNVQPGATIDLCPGSISFWSSKDGVPQVTSDDPSVHITVVPLPGDEPYLAQ
jgi:hypothetical protein